MRVDVASRRRARSGRGPGRGSAWPPATSAQPAAWPISCSRRATPPSASPSPSATPRPDISALNVPWTSPGEVHGTSTWSSARSITEGDVAQVVRVTGRSTDQETADDSRRPPGFVRGDRRGDTDSAARRRGPVGDHPPRRAPAGVGAACGSDRPRARSRRRRAPGSAGRGTRSRGARHGRRARARGRDGRRDRSGVAVRSPAAPRHERPRADAGRLGLPRQRLPRAGARRGARRGGRGGCPGGRCADRRADRPRARPRPDRPRAPARAAARPGARRPPGRRPPRA